jgi:hypothetical protein
MADLNDIQSSGSTKIVGSDSTGLETNPVGADIHGNLKVIDYSTGTTSSSVPSSATFIAGKNSSGNLQGLSVDSSGNVNVNLSDGTGNRLGTVPSAGINNLAVALCATNYVFSTVNSTTAQLAAGATFIGSVETTVNQPSYTILMTSDQPMQITINQYIDAAGTALAYSETFVVNANAGWARSNVVNGNYVNVVVTNIGNATTTTFNLNVAYGIIDSATNLNNKPVALNECNGLSLTATPYGHLSVSPESTALFTDTFDSSGFDTVNRWNSPVTAGAGAASQSSGTLTLSTGTAAASAIGISSQPTFSPIGTSFFEIGGLFQFETNFVTGCHRFFGLGTPNPSYTVTTPLLNAIGFEINSSGNLNACIYSNGSKIWSQNLNTYTSFVKGTPGLLGMNVRADSVYFFVGTTQIPVAVAQLVTPDSIVLPLRMHVLNGASTLSGAPTFKVQALGMGDTGCNSKGISDGYYQWRKANVTPTNSLRTAEDMNAASIQGFSFGINVDTINVNSAESGIILISNPSNSGKNLYFTNILAGADVSSANWVKTRINLNPTITTNGTVQSIANMNAGSSNVSVANAYTSPTYSAKGSTLLTIPSPTGSANPLTGASGTTSDMKPYLVVPPGKSVLFTALAKANATPSVYCIFWFEA